MRADVSVIIPYHNESETLEITLTLLAKQTLQPKEVIFVDSSSTDDSFNVIERWIAENDSKHNISFINLQKGTKLPSSSMNIGIKHAGSDLLAFMDCDLIFDVDWLQKQVEFLNKSNYEIVSGMCYFEGVSLIDRLSTAQTYGYKKFVVAVPSSVLKASVFEKTGLFLEERRAAYDIDWVNKLKKANIIRGINRDVVVSYNGINYSVSLKNTFLKNLTYTASSIGVYKYYTPYYYMLAMLLFAVGAITSPHIILFSPVLYCLLRGYCIPLLKSDMVSLVKKHPISLFLLPVVGFIIDSGKFIGYAKGFFRYFSVKLHSDKG